MVKILVISILLLNLTGSAFSQDINWDKLTQAVITCESSGRPHAVSPAGAIGLMGILPQGALAEWNMCNTRQYTIGDLYSPSINVEIGLFYLKRLYHYYKCLTIDQIAMAYNAGITRCKRVNFDIKKLPNETQTYVKRINKEYN